jgi:hypothetical protein
VAERATKTILLRSARGGAEVHVLAHGQALDRCHRPDRDDVAADAVAAIGCDDELVAAGDQAGLQPGDILLSVAGQPVSVRFVEQVPVLYQRISRLPVGETAGSRPCVTLVRSPPCGSTETMSRPGPPVSKKIRPLEPGETPSAAAGATSRDQRDACHPSGMGRASHTDRPVHHARSGVEPDRQRLQLVQEQRAGLAGSPASSMRESPERS